MTVLGDAFCVIFRAPPAMPELSASFSSSRVLTVVSARGLLRLPISDYGAVDIHTFVHSSEQQQQQGVQVHKCCFSLRGLSSRTHVGGHLC